MDTYKTIIEEASTQFTEKHSKFIGYACHTETDEEAVAFIEKIRALHSDARHNVYAYVLRKDNRARYSDDGEPHGTAGKPILDIINGFGLMDVTVVVTRYFGGILLGTGGLVRAYTKSAKDTLDFAEKYMMVPGVTYIVACEYAQLKKLEAIIYSFRGTVEQTLFEQTVTIIFTIPKDSSNEFLTLLEESFSCSLFAEKIDEKYTKEKILIK